MKHRILVADDENHFARRLSDYFWDQGFEVRTLKHSVKRVKPFTCGLLIASL